MQFQILKHHNKTLAILQASGTVINELQDALDLIANADYQGARDVIVEEEHFCPEFFDLKTGIAGDILQKFSTYRMRMAIVGDFSKYSSKSLRDFIYESNRMGRILFVNDQEEAINKLAKG